MMTINVNGTEYKVKFGYNSFCDSDLLDRTSEVMDILRGKTETNTDSAFTRRLFIVTRDLLFEGFKKKNPVESLTEVGNILDDYFDEGTEDDPHGIVDIFGMLAQELLSEGFFGNLLTESTKAIEKVTKKKVSKKN